MMIVADAANLADSLRRRQVAQVAAEGIARIGRIGDDAAVAENARGLANQARLRIDRMYLEELSHESRRKPTTARAL